MKLKIIHTIQTNNFNPDFNQQVANLMATVKPQLPYVVLYHDYHCDYHNDYAMSICQVVADGRDFDINLNIKRFTEFAHGPFTIANLVEAWQNEWSMEDDHELKRLYSYDFEYYHANGEFSIFLALDESN